ncbi:kinetochore protein Spc25 isoform X2 [Macrotis lagotis]|uniref:kinetochore protein Spc25 isoform X2 n=1 Tax=Macrotis lagotis TaxID=92651 RepID=UPI003D68D99A
MPFFLIFLSRTPENSIHQSSCRELEPPANHTSTILPGAGGGRQPLFKIVLLALALVSGLAAARPTREFRGPEAGAGGRLRRRGMMSHIKTEEELDLFNKSINDFWNRFRNTTFNEHYSQVVGMRDTYKSSIDTLTEKLSIKVKEEDQMVETFLEFRNKIHIQNKLIQEKQDNLSKLVSSIQDKEWEMEKLTKSIKDLKESLDKKKEIISTVNKANEEKLEMLQKSYDMYKDRLGLEIRKISGEKLQFIFRRIDPKTPEKPFTFSLCLNEEGDYEILDSAPHLECLAEYQEKVSQGCLGSLNCRGELHPSKLINSQCC